MTERAVAVGAAERVELGAAPLWGLLRSAQSEHPDRFSLIDVDDEAASLNAVPAALAAGLDEPQLAVREGRICCPPLDTSPA